MKWMRAITVGVSGLALGAVAACGQGDTVSGSAAPENQAAAAPAEAPAAGTPAGVLTTKLSASTADDVGQIVVNGEGRTVYRFDGDKKEPPTSNCVGDCNVAWHPVLAADGADIPVEGMDKSLIGTLDRSDGGKQITIGGWPAYTYSKDAAPGDVKGQGAAGKWFAFTPAGKKAQSAATAAKSLQLVVMKVAKLGPIVTDAAGMTLYRFDKDTANPSKSNCEGDCAKKWPPLLLADGAQFELNGIDSAKVGTVTRADGSKQVTVGGWPMYHFFKDSKPCDINGQGVDGIWFAAKATGAKAL